MIMLFIIGISFLGCGEGFDILLDDKDLFEIESINKYFSTEFQLNPIGNKSISEGGLLQFAVTASNPDNDYLTFSASNLPDEASFDTDTQIFSWRPGFDQSGVYTGVRFTVTNNSALYKADFEDITIDVGDRVCWDREISVSA